ncbi:MAG: NCS2 family permease [Methanobrevibacter millerae]|uniref:NCS2 family permease n=1 Tax=Methanobrevibacter millerae TaxID=230361 RepID=A0A8T3VIJ8_9EURY|nr:NCS2 family permease [Methanobrevibacter millerae]MBE6505926.1 NCS2 family permease [Methanobrevibacter millerae]
MLNKFFKLDENNTNLKTEFLAGLTTFLAMAYILGVNPTLLSQGGMPSTGVFFATALASGISCIIMGLISKYPVGIAPGMGIIPVFTYTIIISMGNTWETALAAVFVSSILFLLITISGLREIILNAIPLDLKFAIGAGIGFFLAFVGLKGAGIIVGDSSTLVAMGNISSAPALLAVIGVMITLILYLKKVHTSVFLGLVITSILGVIFTLFGFGAGNALMPSIPTEFISFNFDMSLVGAFTKGFGQLFSNIPNLLTIIFSLLFVTFFDTTGTLIPLANQCGFIDEEGNAEGIDRAFLADALSGIIGAVLGTSTLNAYVESATGIGLGGRTGLTAIFIGIFFLLSLVFAPTVLSLFTSSVTAAALVIVGILMATQLKEVDWNNMVMASSVFITTIMMILTYSITIGISWGFITYAIASLATGKTKEFKPITWLLIIVFAVSLFLGL